MVDGLVGGQPFLQRTKVVFIGQETRKFEKRLHAPQTVLKTFNVFCPGERLSMYPSTTRRYSVRYPFGGFLFFSTWVKIHSVL